MVSHTKQVAGVHSCGTSSNEPSAFILASDPAPALEGLARSVGSFLSFSEPPVVFAFKAVMKRLQFTLYDVRRLELKVFGGENGQPPWVYLGDVSHILTRGEHEFVIEQPLGSGLGGMSRRMQDRRRVNVDRSVVHERHVSFGMGIASRDVHKKSSRQRHTKSYRGGQRRQMARIWALFPSFPT
jgi:hypothetical protein